MEHNYFFLAKAGWDSCLFTKQSLFELNYAYRQNYNSFLFTYKNTWV